LDAAAVEHKEPPDVPRYVEPKTVRRRGRHRYRRPVVQLEYGEIERVNRELQCLKNRF
jgi:hypothetical protein